MGSSMPAGRKRDSVLSRDGIVKAAIEILDENGEGALTFRSLTMRLSTGPGAIYHHLANKDDLLAAAVDVLVSRAVTDVVHEGEPAPAIRALALAFFDTIDAHPWLGSRLSSQPWQPGVMRIVKAIGLQLRGMGISGAARSDAGAALLSYVLGAAARYAAGARRAEDDADRKVYLETIAAQWARGDPDPFVQETASLLREHDDREQFLAGVDIFLAGLAARP